MSNLNKSWLALIVIGIFFLFFYFAYNIIEGISSGNTSFNPTINEFERGNLISNQLEKHLTLQQ